MRDLTSLAAVARALLPPGVAVAAADPRRLHPLWPGEALVNPTPARLAEFSAGRHAARAAVAALGPAVAIPHGADRAPQWPAGFTGSITHTATACLAAAARAPLGIGLDLEKATPLDPALWDSVLSPEEARAAGATPDPGLAAKLIFSAKEAAYKAQYPASRTLFGFDTLTITLSGDRFTATFTRAIGPFAAGQALHGRHVLTQGHILTAVTL